MRKLTMVLSLLLMSIVLVACGSTKVTNESQTQLVNSYLDSLKAGDFATAKTHLETVPENFDYNENDVMKAFFAKLEYTVGDVKSTETGGEVKVTIKLPNTTLVYDSMMDEIGEEVQKLQASDDTSKEKASGMMVAYMLKKLNDPAVTMIENTVTVEVKQGEKDLLLVPNESLSAALSGIAVK